MISPEQDVVTRDSAEVHKQLDHAKAKSGNLPMQPLQEMRK